MESSWDGKERRSSSEFEREVIAFMSRVDQRNQDRDLQAAIRDEAAAKSDKEIEDRFEKIEGRTTDLETSRTILKTIYLGAPAVGSVAWLCFEVGKFIKGLKGG